MPQDTPTASPTTYDSEVLIERLERDEPIELTLPDGGMLYLERPLPFLTLYRNGDRPGRYDLHSEEAAYCVLRGNATEAFQQLLVDLLGYLSDKFGGVLLLEIWIAESAGEEETDPLITIHGPARHQPAVERALRDNLEAIRFSDGHLRTAIGDDQRRHPSGTEPLFSTGTLKRREILYLGLEIAPFFLGASGETYPVYLRSFRDQLRKALQRTFFQFIRLETTWNAARFHDLANRKVSDLVWETDRRLVEISNRFRFLMLVTATNDDAAFDDFERSGFQKTPHFHYRFLPVDPESLKRELYQLPIEKIKDPTLGYFFRDKREETARMLDMLAWRGHPNFRYSSMQVFGTVEDSLRDVADRLLAEVPASTHSQGRPAADRVSAEAFLDRSRSELAALHEQWPHFEPRAELRDDLSGLMVSQGTLMIGHRFSAPEDRVEALIQHEVGTHVLTYWNGRAQPLNLLYSGVPGYEELQEGLAVLAEWFVGGLTGNRLRTLAGRVVGIDNMLRGSSFSDTFQLLHREHGFGVRESFYTTARIYRGGGFTKDAVYLRGLVQLLDYLRGGKDLETLFIGKIRVGYIPLIEELVEREILHPAPLLPRYYLEDRAAGHPKLKRLQAGLTVFDLIK